MEKIKRKKLPIGISNFKEIIENNYYYVDKTNFIENILEEGFKVELFTRPRRFGKTLNISMLNYFFNIENKEVSIKNPFQINSSIADTLQLKEDLANFVIEENHLGKEIEEYKKYKKKDCLFLFNIYGL